MRLSRVLVLLLFTAFWGEIQGASHRCWIAKVIAEGDAVRLAFGKEPDLRIRVGTAISKAGGLVEIAPPNESPVTEYTSGATLVLKNGQIVEITLKGKKSHRCLVSPILGPQFVGVSLGHWFKPDGSPEPWFMGSVIKAGT